MKYSLISDMHLDFPQSKTPYDKLEHNVIVAGDTSNGLLGLKFLQKLRNKGFSVFAVDGNHEHYKNVSEKRTIEETTKRFREDNPNISYFEDTPVIGTNGWYQVSNGNNWLNYMNDGYACIGTDPITATNKMNNLAKEEFYFLDETLTKLSKPCIVVTHTAPCVETLDPAYEGHYSNEWYYNGLMYEILKKHGEKILVWNHGHTHAPAQAVVEGVRVVCNPRGYPGENPSWEPLTIEI